MKQLHSEQICRFRESNIPEQWDVLVNLDFNLGE